jgi:hypothetical protein
MTRKDNQEERDVPDISHWPRERPVDAWIVARYHGISVQTLYNRAHARRHPEKAGKTKPWFYDQIDNDGGHLQYACGSVLDDLRERQRRGTLPTGAERFLSMMRGRHHDKGPPKGPWVPPPEPAEGEDEDDET